MIIGILQTGHLPDEIQAANGNIDIVFQRLLGGRGYEFRVFRVVDMDFPDSPDDADGWLITGSKHGAYDDLPWIPRLEAFIRDIRDAGSPLVGICFGHQIIAQALGGRVEKFAGGWSIGRQSYDFDGETMALNAWHQDQVVALPQGAAVLGRSDMCENAMISYGDRIFTVQAHPEFGPDLVQGLITHRGQGVLPDALLDDARAGLTQPVHNAAMADRLAAVLEKGRPT